MILASTIPTTALNICRNSSDFLTNSVKSGLEIFGEFICWNYDEVVLLLRRASAKNTDGRVKAGFVMVLVVGIGQKGGACF